MTLLCPRGEAGAVNWPARAGDERVAEDLAAARPQEIAAHRSMLYFDGGDFIADSETVFVTPAVARRNVQHTVETPAELRARLAEKITQTIVLLKEAPDHHAGMFMALAGNRTAVVGDPSLARRTLQAAGVLGKTVCGDVGDDFSAATQALFDAVACQCAAAGYRVVRIPVVPGLDRRTYITYVNGIIHQGEQRRVVHMPVFGHVPELNRAAAEVWRSLGYEVRPVDCSAAYTHFGSLHCLVNVVRRRTQD
ncbi:MAG: agmatine deiminase family protein [Planctomycetota bacterium]|nr:agmatine deiminase family protein [Planctomycetota bacterium]